MNVILKDSYKADVFNFDLECFTQEVPNEILFNKDGTVKDGSCTKQIPLFNLTINNAISWDWMKFKFTKEELKGLSDFITKFLEN